MLNENIPLGHYLQQSLKKRTTIFTKKIIVTADKTPGMSDQQKVIIRIVLDSRCW